MSHWRRISVLCLLTGAYLLAMGLAVPAAATPVSEKKARLVQVQRRLQEVHHRAGVAVEKYNQATSRLETVRREVEENRRLLRKAEYNLAVANKHLEMRAQRMYKTHNVGIVDVLFASRTFDDLVTQFDLMERVGNSDAETVRAVDAYRADVEARRIKLRADKKAAAELVTERAAQKNTVVALENELESVTAGLRDDIRRLEAAQRSAARRAAERAQNDTGSFTGPSADPGGPGRPEVVTIAKRYLGVPYVWGGASPRGFDCSGFTMYVYAKIGISLAHGATLQQRASTPVPISALQPGDLVFFGNAAFSSHNGIYVGGTTMIHAPHTGAVVSYGDMSKAWIGGRF